MIKKLFELDKLKISKIFINTHYKSEMVHSFVRKHRSFNKITFKSFVNNIFLAYFG